MKFPDFRQAQLEVQRIKKKMGKEPATFDDSPTKETPRESEWTVGMILTIMFLVGVLIVVTATAAFVFLDMWGKGMFDPVLRGLF